MHYDTTLEGAHERRKYLEEFIRRILVVRNTIVQAKLLNKIILYYKQIKSYDDIISLL